MTTDSNTETTTESKKWNFKNPIPLETQETVGGLRNLPCMQLIPILIPGTTYGSPSAPGISSEHSPKNKSWEMPNVVQTHSLLPPPPNKQNPTIDTQTRNEWTHLTIGLQLVNWVTPLPVASVSSWSSFKFPKIIHQRSSYYHEVPGQQ